MKKSLLTIAFALLFVATVWAEVTLTAVVEPASATIGDQVFYRITIKGDDGPIRPQIKLPNPEPFELVNVETAEGNPATIVFTLAPFDTGKLKLPTYTYTWTDTDGNIQSVSAPDIFLDVKPVSGKDEPSLDALAPPAEPVRDVKKYLPLAGGLLLLVLLVAIAWYLLRKRKKPAADPARPEETPYQKAMRNLDELIKARHYEEGRVKEYFSTVSDIVREFIERETGTAALELTTSEFEQNFPAKIHSHKGEVISLLELCDRAKFAKEQPTNRTAEEVFSASKRFIEATATRKTPEETPANK